MAAPALAQPTGGGSSAPASTPTAHSIVVQTTIELIGVGLMAIFAGINDGLGKVMLTIMVAFFVIWLIVNVAEFENIVKKA